MKLAIILAVIICAAAPSYALNIEHVTYTKPAAPGSLKIKYTGLRSVIINETIDFLSDQWESDALIYLTEGKITLSQYGSSIRRLNNTVSDGKYNGQWWNRIWHQSFMPDKGGAQKTKQIKIGRAGDIIDLGFARINEDLKFKIKEYTVDFSDRWKFRIRPKLSANTNDIISKATVQLVFQYSIRGIKRFSFSIVCGYSKRLNEFMAIKMEFLRI